MAVMTDYAHAGTPARRRGFFARLFEGMVQAREREAERLIRAHLGSLDAETLRSWGYDPKSLKWVGDRARRA
ncbi:MAG TPA: hypothetical protein VHG92_00640 [Afifellaceae bacterium]|nr:hypothetical protein [Afifellaceae bacterium]